MYTPCLGNQITKVSIVYNNFRIDYLLDLIIKLKMPTLINDRIIAHMKCIQLRIVDSAAERETTIITTIKI